MAMYDVSTLPIESFLNYTPVLGLAIAVMVLFLLGGLLVGWQTMRRKYRFMHTMSSVSFFETSGYACLVYATAMSGKGNIFPAYVIMQVFIVMSPNIIQATLYWTIGIVLKFSPDLVAGRRLLRGWVITTLFCTSDVLGITVQTIGISMWATSQSSGDPNPEQIHRGSVITLLGLCIQIVFFFFFTILAIWTHRHKDMALRGVRSCGQLFTGLYCVMALLYVRNTFRLVEFAQITALPWPTSEGTYVLAHQQWMFYVFDALPVLCTFAIFIWAHPGRLLPPPGTVLRPQGARSAEFEPDLEDPAGGGKGSLGGSSDMHGSGEQLRVVALGAEP